MDSFLENLRGTVALKTAAFVPVSPEEDDAVESRKRGREAVEELDEGDDDGVAGGVVRQTLPGAAGGRPPHEPPVLPDRPRSPLRPLCVLLARRTPVQPRGQNAQDSNSDSSGRRNQPLLQCVFRSAQDICDGEIHAVVAGL